MDFGALLKKLRSDRGLNQEQLAKLAGVTVFTISRGERSKGAPWKRSNSVAVLRALAKEAPLSKNEEELYLELTGLQALAGIGLEMRDAAAAHTRSSRDELAAAVAAFSTRDDPDHTTAHTWLQRILDDVPPAKVLTALEGLAAAWSIDLPPKLRPAEASKAGAWIHHTGPIDAGDGHTIQIHTPIEPPRPPARPKAHKRTAG